jgi:hypothetical protein
MLRPVRLADVLAARARWSSAPEPLATARETVRRLWDSVEVIAGSDAAAGSEGARLALHREALRAALMGLAPGAGLSAQEAWRRAPGSTRNLFIGALEDDAAVERLLGDSPAPELLDAATATHKRLLHALEEDKRVVQAYATQRVAGLMVIVVIAVLSGLAGTSFVKWIREPKDLAAGKVFTASSKLMDCHPDNGECGGIPLKILFHTNEERNPWYQVDLGEPAPTYSSLYVRNRTDAAMMRAIPLVVEVSDDGKAFREVTRRTEGFVDWEPHFAPQHARYLRVRVDRISTLHLEALKVRP